MIARLESDIYFLRVCLKALVLNEVVDLGANRQASEERHYESAAEILRIRQRVHTRRGESGLNVLDVIGQLSITEVQQVVG